MKEASPGEEVMDKNKVTKEVEGDSSLVEATEGSPEEADLIRVPQKEIPG